MLYHGVKPVEQYMNAVQYLDNLVNCSRWGCGVTGSLFMSEFLLGKCLLLFGGEAVV